VPDLDVRVEGERPLVDLQRGELVLQHLHQLDVDDELLVAGHEPTLEPPGRVHHPVGAGEERRHERHQRLVAGLRVGDLGRRQAALLQVLRACQNRLVRLPIAHRLSMDHRGGSSRPIEGSVTRFQRAATPFHLVRMEAASVVSRK